MLDYIVMQMRKTNCEKGFLLIKELILLKKWTTKLMQKRLTSLRNLLWASVQKEPRIELGRH